VLATAQVHARITSEPGAALEQHEAFIPRPEYARALAFGFDTLLADFYWIQAVLLIGGAEANPAQHAVALGRMIDVVTTLDPWVGHPYRFAAVWLDQSEEDVRTANRLLRRGIEHHPEDWRQYFYLGFNLFFYLQEYKEAADVLHRAAQLPGAPAYLPRLVARLRSKSADIDAAAILLHELVREAPDDASRAQYQAALDEIEIEHKARQLDRAREAFRKLAGRDLERVTELVQGPHAVLARLPDPEPSSIPEALRRGSVWELDFEEDRIASSYYGHRYELHMSKHYRDRIDAWREAREAREAKSGTQEGRALRDGG